MTIGHVVTVTKATKQLNAKYTVSFSVLPDRTFSPWDFVRTVHDLTISALLSPLDARNLVLDAHVNGTSTSRVNY